MGYNQYEHKGKGSWPMNSSWFSRKLRIDEDGDILCTYCPKTISEGDSFWVYNYQDEKKVRCEVCIGKLKAGKEVKEGYDYTIVDLFKYRKPAELHMRIMFGDKEIPPIVDRFMASPHKVITENLGRYQFQKAHAYKIADCYKPFLPKI
ncbi:MAG: hypothetical protein ACXABY_36265, partial [Candidatus Thorarchaeota archaeon]